MSDDWDEGDYPVSMDFSVDEPITPKSKYSNILYTGAALINGSVTLAVAIGVPIYLISQRDWGYVSSVLTGIGSGGATGLVSLVMTTLTANAIDGRLARLENRDVS